MDWAEEMVAQQIRARGVRDQRVLEAMRRVPRHRFCPGYGMVEAYGDHPLSIGHGQTISQPYIVAVMTEALEVGPGDKVLEIGTGSGYQAAVLAELGCEVYTVEIVPDLAQKAREQLQELGYDNVCCRCDNAMNGWPEQAPFGAAVGTCAPVEPPPAIIEQLRVGACLVLPLEQGGWSQWLEHIRKTENGTERRQMMPVRFVPMQRG